MKIISIIILLVFFVFQNLNAQDSSRFEFIGKKQKDLALQFLSQKIDTFLFLEKQNYAGLIKDTILVIYRKNAITYKQFSFDKSDFSTPIQIDNSIIDSFFINKIAKLNRKERKKYKEISKWHFHIFPNGTYFDLDFCFGKKRFSSFLHESKYALGGYYKQEFYHWLDKLEVEMRKPVKLEIARKQSFDF